MEVGDGGRSGGDFTISYQETHCMAEVCGRYSSIWDHNESELQKFFNLANNNYSKIKFTMENISQEPRNV